MLVCLTSSDFDKKRKKSNLFHVSNTCSLFGFESPPKCLEVAILSLGSFEYISIGSGYRSCQEGKLVMYFAAVGFFLYVSTFNVKFSSLLRTTRGKLPEHFISFMCKHFATRVCHLHKPYKVGLR